MVNVTRVLKWIVIPAVCFCFFFNGSCPLRDIHVSLEEVALIFLNRPVSLFFLG